MSKRLKMYDTGSTLGQCTGRCCTPFTVFGGHVSMKEIKAHKQMIIDKNNSLERYSTGSLCEDEDDFLYIANMVYTKEPKQTSDGRYIYHCKHFDDESRACKNYDSRPKMCRRYPGKSKCVHEGCTVDFSDKN